MKANPYAEAVEAGSVGLVEWLASPAEVQDLTPADWLQARKMSEAAVAAAMGPLLAPLREVVEDFRSEVDWSDGRSNYGDNEAYEACARRLTEALDALERGGERG